MKKFTSIFSTIILFAFFFCTTAAEAVEFTPPFDINAKSVYLMSLDEDSVIYQKNAESEQMPASLVNIMTAIIVLENCDNPDEVTITADKKLYEEFEEYEYQDDLRYGEIWHGDEFTVTDYLYALMLTSSCEAANILAYHFGNQNISSFVDKMNEKAQEIGAKKTVFANPHGLYDPRQVTTAYDMALITKYALSIPKFETISTTVEYEASPKSYTTEHHENSWIWSHSNIITSDASDFYLFGVKGIKTGNLILSGRNLVTLGSYDGNRYLLVILNASFYDEEGDSKYYHIIDAYNIMDWVFDNFEYKELISANEEIAEIKVENSDGGGYVLVNPKQNYSTIWYNEIDVTSIQKNIKLFDAVNAPVKKGQKLGEIELKLSDEVITTVDLVASVDVERSFVKFNLETAKEFIGSKWMKLAIILSISLSLFYLLICIWAFVYMKKNPKTGLANKKIVKKLYGRKKK